MEQLIAVSGVYKIICSVTGKYYVGSSKDVRHRQLRHLWDLQKGCHHSIYLQRAWNKYGEDNFHFELYKVCDNYQEEEQKILDEFFDQGLLLNVSKSASGGDLLSYHPDKEKIIAKITKTIHENIESMSEEERKEKWSRPGKENGMFGKHHLIKSKEQMRESHKGQAPTFLGKTHTEETKKQLSDLAKLRTGEKNSFYGRTHSDETKKILRAQKLGKKPGNLSYYKIDGEYYAGLYQAADILGISFTVIQYRVKSKTFENYSKVSKEEYMANKSLLQEEGI